MADRPHGHATTVTFTGKRLRGGTAVGRAGRAADADPAEVRAASANPTVRVPWHLHLEAQGNGFVYPNGHALGRTWEEGPQRDFYVPESWLNFGTGAGNVVAVSLRPGTKGAAVRAASVAPGAAFAETRVASALR